MKNVRNLVVNCSLISFFFLVLNASLLLAYEVKYTLIGSVLPDNVGFLMNDNGTVVYKNYDEENRIQLYLFKDGVTKQITSYQTTYYSYTIKNNFYLNNNDQIVWVLSEFYGNGKSNDFVVLADLNKNEITKISVNISEYFNKCAYPTINDLGEVAWMQMDESDSIKYLFLYKNQETKNILTTSQELFYPNINKNGFITYAAKNVPSSKVYKAYLWDGNSHKRIDNSKDGESCMYPIIDQKNNVVYYMTNSNGQRNYWFYSWENEKTINIDVPANAGDPFSSIKDVSFENGSLLFTGKDGNIYLYKDEKTEKLTTKNVNYNPDLKNGWIGWIFRENSGKGKINIRTPGEDIILDSVYCHLGLVISSKGHFLFTRIDSINPSKYLLYHGLLKFEAGKDATQENSNSFIFPNPAEDNLNIKLDNLYDSKIEIYSLEGLKIIEFDNLKTGNNQLNISSLYKGIYFIKYAGKIEKFVKL